jgi:hypothetical protein
MKRVPSRMTLVIFFAPAAVASDRAGLALDSL